MTHGAMTHGGLALGAGLLLVAAVIGACVIAEPPVDLPAAPVIRPTIVRSAAVPPPTGVITRWPGTFYVPVQLSDARMTFYAAYFVDYNPITGEGYQDTIASSPSPGDTRPVRTLPISITEPARDGCHTVEVVVARELLPTISGDGRFAHTPSSPNDGDSITWFYSPNGDPSGCPVVDAGLLPDAAALDASDGGAL